MTGKSVADAVRDARMRLGLSVRQLAPRVRKSNGLRIGASYVTDIEKGRGIPSEYVAGELARALSMDVDAFSALCMSQRSRRTS